MFCALIEVGSTMLVENGHVRHAFISGGNVCYNFNNSPLLFR